MKVARLVNAAVKPSSSRGNLLGFKFLTESFARENTTFGTYLTQFVHVVGR